MSAPEASTARKKLRPIRPKPLMPTRMVTGGTPRFGPPEFIDRRRVCADLVLGPAKLRSAAALPQAGAQWVTPRLTGGVTARIGRAAGTVAVNQTLSEAVALAGSGCAPQKDRKSSDRTREHKSPFPRATRLHGKAAARLSRVA